MRQGWGKYSKVMEIKGRVVSGLVVYLLALFVQKLLLWYRTCLAKADGRDA